MTKARDIMTKNPVTRAEAVGVGVGADPAVTWADVAAGAASAAKARAAQTTAFEGTGPKDAPTARTH